VIFSYLYPTLITFFQVSHQPAHIPVYSGRQWTGVGNEQFKLHVIDLS